MKFGGGVGAAIGLFVLNAYGYDPQVPASPEALQGIRLAISLIPAFICVVAAGIAVVYPINQERIAQIEQDLKARRAHQQTTE